MESIEQYEQRGYLLEDFRLFHLRDSAGQELEFHYHDFEKIVIFISGKVTYLVEGVSYILEPGDILLIRHGMIHKALVDTSAPYERIIIYLNPAFLAMEDGNLNHCFSLADARRFYLMRVKPSDWVNIIDILSRLEAALKDTAFAAETMTKTLFLQAMVMINRVMLADTTDLDEGTYKRDHKITDVINYINANLAEDLSVDTLASRVYVSKYHFMRRFKELTGYTVHAYIKQKRLLYASELLRRGTGAVQSAAMSGFQDYSAFQRSFRDFFGVTPSKYV